MSETDDGKYGVREGEEGRFLQRWSRRKQETTPVEDLVPVDAMPPAVPPLTDADMPPIDDLDGRSDYGMFLSPAVSDQLRRLALRKLFHSSEFNVRDGLDDYDGDFSQFTKLGDVITAELKRRLERELKGRGKTQAGESIEGHEKPVESALMEESGEGTQDERLAEDPEQSAPVVPVERATDAK